MPYESDDYLSRHFQTSGIDVGLKVDELVSLDRKSTRLNSSH